MKKIRKIRILDLWFDMWRIKGIESGKGVRPSPENFVNFSSGNGMF